MKTRRRSYATPHPINPPRRRRGGNQNGPHVFEDLGVRMFDDGLLDQILPELDQPINQEDIDRELGRAEVLAQIRRRDRLSSSTSSSSSSRRSPRLNRTHFTGIPQGDVTIESDDDDYDDEDVRERANYFIGKLSTLETVCGIIRRKIQQLDREGGAPRDPVERERARRRTERINQDAERRRRAPRRPNAETRRRINLRRSRAQLAQDLIDCEELVSTLKDIERQLRRVRGSLQFWQATVEFLDFAEFVIDALCTTYLTATNEYNPQPEIEIDEVGNEFVTI